MGEAEQESCLPSPAVKEPSRPTFNDVSPIARLLRGFRLSLPDRNNNPPPEGALLHKLQPSKKVTSIYRQSVGNNSPSSMKTWNIYDQKLKKSTIVLIMPADFLHSHRMRFRKNPKTLMKMQSRDCPRSSASAYSCSPERHLRRGQRHGPTVFLELIQ